MADESEILQLTDATVKLLRGQKFMHGKQQVAMGDRMTVQEVYGNEDDVVVIQVEGKTRVKRIAQHMTIPTGAGSVSLENLDAEDEKRLLAIYNLFPTPGENDEVEARLKHDKEQEQSNRQDNSMYIDED